MFFKRCIQVAGVLVLTTGNAWCEPESDTSVTEKSADPSVLEWSFAQYQVEPSNITKSAVYAMVDQGWDVEKIEKGVVVGTISDNREPVPTEVQIKFDAFPKVEIRQTKGSEVKPKWLLNLKVQMLSALLSCMK